MVYGEKNEKGRGGVKFKAPRINYDRKIVELLTDS